MCIWYTNLFSSTCCTICKEFSQFELNAFSMEEYTRYRPRNKFCKAQRLNVNLWPSHYLGNYKDYEVTSKL